MNKNTKKSVGPLLKLMGYVKPYWGRLLIAFLALVVSSSLFIIIGKGLGELTDIIMSENIDKNQLTLRLNNLMFYAGPVLGGFAIGLFFRNYLMQWIGERASVNLRDDVFSNVIHLTPSFYDRCSYGQIQTRIIADARELQNVVGNAIPNFLHHSLLLIGGVIYAIYISPVLSLVVASCIPIIFLPGIIWSGKVKRLAMEKQSALATSGDFVGEVLRNLKLVQAYRYQSTGAKRYSGMLDSLFAVSVRGVRLESYLNALTSFLAYVILLAVLWYGGQQVFADKITPGDLVMFVYFANVVTNSAAQLVSVTVSLSAAIGAASRLLELRDESDRLSLPAPGESILVDKISLGKIRFESLSFAYPSRLEKMVLNGIDLEISAGQTVSIVGPSGAGKTTLFDLLQKFYIPQSGRILVDGIDISDVEMDELMRSIAIVPQNSELFSGTVMENMCIGMPDASEAEVWIALEQAQATKFVQDMPDGLQTDLGQEGVRLSGGQKQRLSIARAIIKRPKILLLDEPTSALDIESEALVQKAFDASRKGRTTLIVTHRLSTAIKADTIVMMLGGRLLAVGTHSELMSSCPEYAGLVRLSFEDSLAVPGLKETDIQLGQRQAV